MNWEELARELSIANETKIILLVVDGVGGLPQWGRTELESAQKPNLDHLTATGICGLTDPVSAGITPGSGPAHLALFGYDPLRYRLGRGILEALGSGVEVTDRDLVARGNFATLKEGLIIDRRAGRLATAETERLCAKINETFKEKDGSLFQVAPGKEHRFVLKISGEGLSDALSDADPQKDHLLPAPASALGASGEAAGSASLVNGYIQAVTDLLKDEPVANTILLRGFSKLPTLPAMADLYKVKAAAAACYPMYRGLAKLVGMEILQVGAETEDLIAAVERSYRDYNFFYVHYKKTDSAGEDGAFEAKVRAIEEVDRFLPRLIGLNPDVLAVTSDHSTPALLKSHSWHPNPFLLAAKSALPDRVTVFTERECGQGLLGRFPALQAMALLLAHAGRLKKFGA